MADMDIDMDLDLGIPEEYAIPEEAITEADLAVSALEHISMIVMQG